MHVNGGGLPGIYVVEQFHFHWGSEKDMGSEHELNGYYYPMEVSKTMNFKASYWMMEDLNYAKTMLKHIH